MTGESKQIIVGLNSYPLKDEKARADIAPEFSKSVSYAVGDYVLREGHLYKFTSAHSVGNWSASDVTQVAVGGELSSLGETDKSIESSIGSIESSIAIVANGDAHIAIASGQYVYVKNHSTLAEGLYTANSAIGADVALTVSNLTAVSGGGLNSLKNKAEEILVNSKLVSNGGTGLTTNALGIESGYSTLGAVINQYRSNVSFPFSITKIGFSEWSDLPSGMTTREANIIVFGTPGRLTVFCSQYQGSACYIRHMYSGSWNTEWVAL